MSTTIKSISKWKNQTIDLWNFKFPHLNLSSSKAGVSFVLTLGLSVFSFASQQKHNNEYLVKLVPGAVNNYSIMNQLAFLGGKTEVLMGNWVKVTDTKGNFNAQTLAENTDWVEYVQPNYKIKLLENYKTTDPIILNQIEKLSHSNRTTALALPDNPAIPSEQPTSSGEDPLYSKQWGMIDNHVKEAWQSPSLYPMLEKPMIVAVIDTGVDYTHEDLLPNLWRNPGEVGLDGSGKNKESNGIDDDNNGYIDDVVGWDFVSNDNKPFDLAVDPLDLLKGGGNPGHGTHCAGNVAASANNNKGVVGVAPKAKIMSLRFISEKGAGTTADAIKAIKYAMDNGAMITSNSWGSEGEDPNDNKENQALKDVIKLAQEKGVLFIAAAGNGHQGVGYNNDTDPRPAYPSSYNDDIIISVAALDSNNQLGSFSNWGSRSVDIGAPGVKVFSTTVGSQYSDTVINKLGIIVYWDGTSMATPHVAGAAALYWSHHPEKNWQEVKEAILKSAKPIPALNGKVSSNGKLDALGLMNFK